MSATTPWDLELQRYPIHKLTVGSNKLVESAQRHFLLRAWTAEHRALKLSNYSTGWKTQCSQMCWRMVLAQLSYNHIAKTRNQKALHFSAGVSLKTTLALVHSSREGGCALREGTKKFTRWLTAHVNWNKPQYIAVVSEGAWQPHFTTKIWSLFLSFRGTICKLNANLRKNQSLQARSKELEYACLYKSKISVGSKTTPAVTFKENCDFKSYRWRYNPVERVWNLCSKEIVS